MTLDNEGRFAVCEKKKVKDKGHPTTGQIVSGGVQL
jgi:hypothetical protein